MLNLNEFMQGGQVAVYGLAGNPPHAGHWECVKYLINQGFKVLITPSYSHAFGKTMAPFDLRVKWLSESGRDFPGYRKHFLVWDVEKRLYFGAPVYSINILDFLRKETGVSGVLAIGPDNAVADVFAKFKNSSRISSEYGVVVTPEIPNVRSTWIRQQITEGKGSELSALISDKIIREVVDYYRKSVPNHNPLVKLK